MLHTPGFIALDVESVLEVVRQTQGRCRFVAAAARGETRSSEVVTNFCRSRLLGESPDLKGTQAMVLGILAGRDIRLVELDEISKGLRAAVAPECEIRLGSVLDATFEREIHLVALLFEEWRPHGAMEELLGIAAEVAPEMRGARRGGGKGERRRTSPQRRGLERFRDLEATIVDGENLDIPTYQRQNLRLER